MAMRSPDSDQCTLVAVTSIRRTTGESLWLSWLQSVRAAASRRDGPPRMAVRGAGVPGAVARAGPRPAVPGVAGAAAAAAAPPQPLHGESGVGTAAAAGAGAGRGEVPSLSELAAAVPRECFEPDVGRSLLHFAIDFGLLVACFAALGPLAVR